ncbi:MFS general substrate transporter [Aulographum hederae CBS 113979]|uniref:MFS general substrate transporter n=1 Tax=Aulographum hederae CBS 113979 TaxID=1176131 RepID=A0A6G1H172_9PEZI|nr:MFS general substrate transporter [Aulographum hederae CBS 113979]
MYLTQQKRISPRDPNKFPTSQLFLLALVRLAEPIALTSIFPYAWKLVLHFQIGDKHDAAFYAGILIAAFSLAEAITGMYWGGLSDRIGRKPVLLLGCAGTLISLLIVGFAQSFWFALFGRIAGGLLNGNIGIIQTMVGELVTKPEHEPRAYAVMPFVWSIGTICGPAIGGYFANPHTEWPNVFPSSSIFASFPYLLPNVICALLLLVSLGCGFLFLEETHPDMQPWSTQEDLDNTTAETPIMPTTGTTFNAAADLSTESYGTFDQVQITKRDKKKGSRASSLSDKEKPRIFNRRVVMLIVALGLFTYHSMAYDHLLPIFLQDVPRNSGGEVSSQAHLPALSGGLGLSIKEVGVIMSFNGIIALLVQAVVFPLMASWFGVWKLFLFVSVGHPIASFIVPFLVTLPDNWLMTGIYSCLTIRNFFYILAYPLILILIKEAAPSPSHLGKINGLAASTGGACRCIASPVAGILYGIGSDLNFSALAWWASALVAVIGVAQLPFIKRQKKMKAHIHAPTNWAYSDDNEQQPLLQDQYKDENANATVDAGTDEEC